MSTLLYRLGRWSARRAWVVIGVWLTLLALAAGAYALWSKPLAASFDIPGTESIEVLDRLATELPKVAGASGIVVYSTETGGPLTDAERSAISANAAEAAKLPAVTNVVDPFESTDSTAAQRAQYEDGLAQLADAQGQLDAAVASGIDRNALQLQQGLIDEKRQVADAAGVLLDNAQHVRTLSEDGSTALVNITFNAPLLELPEEHRQTVMEYFSAHPIDGLEMHFSNDLAQGVPEIFGVNEAIGVAVAGVVLLILFGTATAAVLPLVSAIWGVGIGYLASMSLSGSLTMNSVTPVLALMLGLAVGIDYALFIINRHRRQLLEGAEVHESIGLANGTSGGSVVFAGSTVVVALLALNVTGVPFIGVMGTVGAIAVVTAVCMAITMTPALLGLVGERMLTKRARAALAAGERRQAPPAKPMATWRAVVTVVVGAVVLLGIAAPALSMRLGLPDAAQEAEDSTVYQAYEIMERQFGAGQNGPLLIAVHLPGDTTADLLTEREARISQVIMDVGDVAGVAPVGTTEDNSTVAFQVLPAQGPSSESTEQLVHRLRDLGTIDGAYRLEIAGQAAVNIDISERLSSVLPTYLVVVVGLSLFIMVGVFRSLLVPLIATGGFVLSLFATLGATVAVFQWGWAGAIFGVHTPGPILSFLPMVLVGVLFGLAMDYQLFLASGMRESFVRGADARVAVAEGFRAGRVVVIAAALIMMSVFGGFAFSHAAIIRPIGFALTIGVLFDAFVVRLLLMPALMHLLGRSAWWFPRWLDESVPDIDVEGARLEQAHRV